MNAGIFEAPTVEVQGVVVGPTAPVRFGGGGLLGDAAVAAELAGWLPLVEGEQTQLEALLSGHYAVDDDVDLHASVGTGLDADGDGSDASVDCDDSESSVNPGATEVWYDGVDTDCDGVSD